MYCKHCGKPIDDDAKFCPECGGIQREVSQQSQQPTPPAHTPILQVSDVSETQPTPTDTLQEEPTETTADKTHELEVESETRTNSVWPWTLTYVIITIAVVLLIAWALMVRYGGDEMSVGVSEIAFEGTELNAGDTVKIAVISQDEPLTIYGTSKDEFSHYSQTGGYFECLDYCSMDPNERQVIEYTVPTDGTWGIMVKGPDDDRANFKMQFLEPLTDGHVRFTFIPAYLILMALVVILASLFIRHPPMFQHTKKDSRKRGRSGSP